MKNLFIIILLVLGCKAQPAKAIKIDTSKLLLSEMVSFNDTSNNKRDTAFSMICKYDQRNRLVEILLNEHNPDGIISYKLIYDANDNLIEEQKLNSGKTTITEYHYLGGVPVYSNYQGSKEHLEDYTVAGNKIIKMVNPKDSVAYTFTYEGNNVIMASISSEMKIINTYIYGTKRSIYYGRNYKWLGIGGAAADNEILEVKDSIVGKDKNIYTSHKYTYNEHGYPVKDIEVQHDEPSNPLWPPTTHIVYYKYILANKPSKKTN